MYLLFTYCWQVKFLRGMAVARSLLGAACGRGLVLILFGSAISGWLIWDKAAGLSL
jgi:hypothetical protein